MEVSPPRFFTALPEKHILPPQLRIAELVLLRLVVVAVTLCPLCQSRKQDEIKVKGHHSGARTRKEH